VFFSYNKSANSIFSRLFLGKPTGCHTLSLSAMAPLAVDRHLCPVRQDQLADRMPTQ
jgi:hypothetical protein